MFRLVKVKPSSNRRTDDDHKKDEKFSLLLLINIDVFDVLLFYFLRLQLFLLTDSRGIT
jgi:hypothetical protein